MWVVLFKNFICKSFNHALLNVVTYSASTRFSLSAYTLENIWGQWSVLHVSDSYFHHIHFKSIIQTATGWFNKQTKPCPCEGKQQHCQVPNSDGSFEKGFGQCPTCSSDFPNPVNCCSFFSLFRLATGAVSTSFTASLMDRILITFTCTWGGYRYFLPLEFQIKIPWNLNGSL